MSFTPELVEELNILALYDLSTLEEGIKVHKTAEPAASKVLPCTGKPV